MRRKWYRSYPVSLQYPQLTLANYGSEFNTSDSLLPVEPLTRGRAQGLELFLENRLHDCLCEQIADSLSRTGQAALDGGENISSPALDARSPAADCRMGRDLVVPGSAPASYRRSGRHFWTAR